MEAFTNLCQYKGIFHSGKLQVEIEQKYNQETLSIV